MGLNMGRPATLPDTAIHAATREHLLEAAGEVFAEIGFRAATVRQICQRAGANIAAVNYHFGDKAELYQAVLKESYEAAIAKYPPNFGLSPRATPEQRLRAFIYSFLLRIFSEGPSARHGKLMAREMIEPTGALDGIVKDDIRPMSVVMMAIVGDLIGRKASEKTKRLCAMSVVSQVLFYHHCRPVVLRLFPETKFDDATIATLTDHITSFSLAALKQTAKKPARQK
jgi:TetR/AcrR family transcriptional regulator, regulator of cefoperazone and chloramphenicol sensitivity